MRSTKLKLWLALGFLMVPGSVVYIAMDWPYYGVAGVAGGIALVFLLGHYLPNPTAIDSRLQEAVGDLSAFTAFSRSFPPYRFVDIHSAVTAIAKESGAVLIASQHNVALADVLNGAFYDEASRTVTTPQQISRPIAFAQEAFFSADGFWIVPGGPGAKSVVRTRVDQYTNRVVLEIAARTEPAATELIDRILERAKAQSIYRNRVIEVLFSGAVRDADGELTRGDGPDIVFREPVVIDADELVLPASTREVIERNVLGFHEHRKALMAAGVSGKKGVLFFGPPGTGKTFTCKYLAGRLGVTAVVASGHALLHIKSICNVARMLQPALVILEDVDLVFSERDVNPFSTALGELMDEMDGFGDEDEITFILTTNDLDRVEKAIKDRPGRVSQCIEFDCPTGDLRERYLRQLFAGYVHDGVDLAAVVKRTAGASPAFLKELVVRAVQFSLERTGNKPQRPADVELSDLDLERAFDEIVTSGGKAGQTIVGFGKAR